MNKDSSLNDKDLKNISGGVTNQNNNDPGRENISGVKCPNCGGFVPVTIKEILYSNNVFCPTCGSKIDIKK